MSAGSLRARVEALQTDEEVVLEKMLEDDVHFIRAWRGPEGGYLIEHGRRAALGRHRTAVTTSAADVVAALDGWSRQNFAWRSRFDWPRDRCCERHTRPAPVSRLPLPFDRHFRFWSYRISHPVLILRSWKREPGEENIEITFDHPIALTLGTSFLLEEIAYADEAQFDEMAELGGIQRKSRRFLHVLALKPVGLVACAGLTIRSYRDEWGVDSESTLVASV